jgi:hypothetical protein
MTGEPDRGDAAMGRSDLHVTDEDGERQGALTIQLGTDSGDDEDLAQLTSRLRDELLQLDVESVELVAGGDAPPGSKGVEFLAVGALIVRIAKSSAALAAMGSALKSWLSRGPGRSVTITIDGDELHVCGISAEEQHRLIDTWIARHDNG